MRCPRCNTEQPEGNRFCEDCGNSLAAPPAGPVCTECGAGADAIDTDGFCTQCGHQRVPSPGDHVEVALCPRCAGVSDRGRRHARNEDALALACEATVNVLVVCDGVSSSQKPDEAARAAATAACEALVQALRAGRPDGAAAMRQAIAAAHAAVHAIPFSVTERDDPPESTFVAAVRRGEAVTLGWLGDSRAYWVGKDVARQITEDHSWVNEVVAAGELTLEEALRSAKAHAITRTLGGPTGAGATGDEPSLLSITLPPGPGHLVLCTDGLWNYLETPEQLAELVNREGAADALAIARNLVAFACERGGQDNVTAVVLALAGCLRPPTPTRSASEGMPSEGRSLASASG